MVDFSLPLYPQRAVFELSGEGGPIVWGKARGSVVFRYIAAVSSIALGLVFAK